MLKRDAAPSPADFRKIRRLQIRASHLVDEAFAGQYHSAFKGAGLEFEEVRPYQPGDDVRSMDWKVTARTSQPHVKIFREERELSVYLLVDVSASQMFGTRRQLKRDLATEVAAALVFLTLRNNDRIGLLLYTDRVEKVVPLGKGLQHSVRVIRELLVCQPEHAGTNTSAALEEFLRTVKRRAVVFLVSDFLDGGAYGQQLRLASRKHDLIALVTTDRAERALPRGGLLHTRDLETGQEAVIDTSSRQQPRQYALAAESLARHRQERLQRLGIDWAVLQTGEDPVEPLRQLFLRRGARR